MVESTQQTIKEASLVLYVGFLSLSYEWRMMMYNRIHNTWERERETSMCCVCCLCTNCLFSSLTSLHEGHRASIDVWHKSEERRTFLTVHWFHERNDGSRGQRMRWRDFLCNWLDCHERQGTFPSFRLSLSCKHNCKNDALTSLGGNRSRWNVKAMSKGKHFLLSFLQSLLYFVSCTDKETGHTTQQSVSLTIMTFITYENRFSHHFQRQRNDDLTKDYSRRWVESK